jgi:hypothetical protein
MFAKSREDKYSKIKAIRVSVIPPFTSHIHPNSTSSSCLRRHSRQTFLTARRISITKTQYCSSDALPSLGVSPTGTISLQVLLHRVRNPPLPTLQSTEVACRGALQHSKESCTFIVLILHAREARYFLSVQARHLAQGLSILLHH